MPLYRWEETNPEPSARDQVANTVRGSPPSQSTFRAARVSKRYLAGNGRAIKKGAAVKTALLPARRRTSYCAFRAWRIAVAVSVRRLTGPTSLKPFDSTAPSFEPGSIKRLLRIRAAGLARPSSVL